MMMAYKYRPRLPTNYDWMADLEPQAQHVSWSVHQQRVRAILVGQHERHGHFAEMGQMRFPPVKKKRHLVVSNPMCPLCEDAARFAYAWAFIWRPKRDVERMFKL